MNMGTKMVDWYISQWLITSLVRCKKRKKEINCMGFYYSLASFMRLEFCYSRNSRKLIIWRHEYGRHNGTMVYPPVVYHKPCSMQVKNKGFYYSKCHYQLLCA